MNRKPHRRAAALGQAPEIVKVYEATKLELDQAAIDAAFPLSILVYEPDGIVRVKTMSAHEFIAWRRAQQVSA